MEKLSQSITELLIALAIAKHSIPPIKKTSQGQSGNRKFMYADLGTIKEAVDPALDEQDLSVLQPVDGNSVGTILFHRATGQFIESWIPIDTSDTPMTVGAAITYMRRYGYSALLNLVTEEDSGVDGLETEPRMRMTATDILEARNKAALTTTRQPADPPAQRERSTQASDPVGSGWIKGGTPQSKKLYAVAFQANKDAIGESNVTDANKFDAVKWAIAQVVPPIASQTQIPGNRLDEVLAAIKTYPDWYATGIEMLPPPGDPGDDVPF
jgi:hypothetical protein